MEVSQLCLSAAALTIIWSSQVLALSRNTCFISLLWAFIMKTRIVNYKITFIFRKIKTTKPPLNYIKQEYFCLLESPYHLGRLSAVVFYL